MAIRNFNKYKPLQVASVSGTPTISKAVPVKITGGESTTGIGEIGIDWTNVSSQADIGIYNESDALMDYYFESFDTGSSSAVVWVYDSWARDGTEQLQVAYGNGPSDQSVAASTVFDNETNLEAGYLYNESSGDLLDVTSNNNNGTLNGPTQGQNGIINGAYSFDGVDDAIDISGLASQINNNTIGHISLWIYFNTLDDRYFKCENSSTQEHLTLCGRNNGYMHFFSEDSSGVNKLLVETDNIVFSTDQWYKIDIVQDGSAIEMYINGSPVPYTEDWGGPLNYWYDEISIDTVKLMGDDASLRQDLFGYYSINHGSEYISASYDAEKATPDFFDQQAVIILGNAIFHGINF